MPADSLFLPMLTSDALIAATSDTAWVQAMLDAEAALATACAAAGLIPADAAAAIEAVCSDPGVVDAGAVGRAARESANPVIALVAELRRAAGEHGDWVHHGATSQDIIDTAAVLVSRRAWAVIDADLDAVTRACARLADEHRHTLMVGRTLLQAALPTTFGMKAATWATAFGDARSGLAGAVGGLQAQLGGGVGTLAAFGDRGLAAASAYAAHLGLEAPVVPWHASRHTLAAVAAALAIAAGAAAKAATDVLLMAQSEVGEASESGRAGRGGSSTMPNKRNAVSAVAVQAAARRAAALVPVFLSSLPVEHERGAGGWQAEWHALGEVLAFAGGAVHHARTMLDGLTIDADAMRANVELAMPGLVAERLVFALAPHVGRTAAAALVSAACADGRGAVEALLVQHGLPETLLDPSGYLGSADALIDRAIARHGEGR